MSDQAQSDTKATAIVYCSFCGKSQHEVVRLIAGPRVFICDECVELCAEIVADVKGRTAARRHAITGPTLGDIRKHVEKIERIARQLQQEGSNLEGDLESLLVRQNELERSQSVAELQDKIVPIKSG